MNNPFFKNSEHRKQVRRNSLKKSRELRKGRMQFIMDMRQANSTDEIYTLMRNVLKS